MHKNKLIIFLTIKFFGVKPDIELYLRINPLKLDSFLGEPECFYRHTMIPRYPSRGLASIRQSNYEIIVVVTGNVSEAKNGVVLLSKGDIVIFLNDDVVIRDKFDSISNFLKYR